MENKSFNMYEHNESSLEIVKLTVSVFLIKHKNAYKYLAMKGRKKLAVFSKHLDFNDLIC